MADKEPSKADSLRAMREANYAANHSRGRRDEAHPVGQPASAPRRSERPKVAASGQRPREGIAPLPREANPAAKATKAKPSGLDAKGPSKTPVTPADRVVSRLGAGRTAQDTLRSETAEAVAIQKRGRPKVNDPTRWSRATKYRRQKEQRK